MAKVKLLEKSIFLIIYIKVFLKCALIRIFHLCVPLTSKAAIIISASLSEKVLPDRLSFFKMQFSASIRQTSLVLSTFSPNRLSANDFEK